MVEVEQSIPSRDIDNFERESKEESLSVSNADDRIQPNNAENTESSTVSDSLEYGSEIVETMKYGFKILGVVTDRDATDEDLMDVATDPGLQGAVNSLFDSGDRIKDRVDDFFGF